MLGGLLIGDLLDTPRLGWAIVFVMGMATWGGGYSFQRWQNDRLARGLRQDVDFKQAGVGAEPMVLYVFYGAYDALWLIGAESRGTARTAVLVGAYKSLQAAGGAIAWHINALRASPMSQLAMNWGCTSARCWSSCRPS